MTDNRILLNAAVAAILVLGGLPATAADTRTLGTTAPSATLRVQPGLLAQVIRLDCVVRGTPVEFPGDIVLINTGPATVPAGYKIKWEAPATNPYKTGIYSFGAPLEPQKHVFLNNVIGGGMAAETPCKVTPVK